MIILSCPVADFASTVVGGQKVCLSLADKFKFCRANFLEHQHLLTNKSTTFLTPDKKIFFLPCWLMGLTTNLDGLNLFI